MSQRIETNYLHLNPRDSAKSKPVVTLASYPWRYRSTRLLRLETGKYAKCCWEKSEERPADKNPWGKYLGSRANGEFLPLDKSQSKHPERTPPRSQIPVDADWTGPTHQRYLLSVAEDRSIDACVFSSLPVRGPGVRDLPPTSVHAYKSRQSQIPSGGLSRGGREGAMVNPRGRAALTPAKGILLPTCKWSAFIVRKESAVWICEVGIETKNKRKRYE